MSTATLTPYSDARAAIKAAWAGAWTGHDGVPVIWKENTAPVIPDPSEAANWLELEIDTGREQTVAFGGGLHRNEKVLSGSVVVRSYAAIGTGDDALFGLLDAALAVFRSRRDGDLNFIGQSAGYDQGPSEDGNWFFRAGLAVFEFRFRG